MDNINSELVAISKQYLYKLLHTFFGKEPTKEHFTILFSDATFESLDVLSDFNSHLKSYQNILQKKFDTYTKFPDKALESAKTTYVMLFIGPDELKAPPWESVYRTGENVLFQVETLEVRDAYKEAGYEAKDYKHRPDDHIATEFDFLASLSSDALDALDAEDDEDFQKIIKFQMNFIEKHLLKWAPEFIQDVQKEAKGSIYTDLGLLSLEILKADLELLQKYY